MIVSLELFPHSLLTHLFQVVLCDKRSYQNLHVFWSLLSFHAFSFIDLPELPELPEFPCLALACFVDFHLQLFEMSIS